MAPCSNGASFFVDKAKGVAYESIQACVWSQRFPWYVRVVSSDTLHRICTGKALALLVAGFVYATVVSWHTAVPGGSHWDLFLLDGGPGSLYALPTR